VAAGVAGLVLVTAIPAAAATWEIVPSPNDPGSNELFAVAGSDTGHVWAVGEVVDYAASPPTVKGQLLRFDGSSWRRVAHPRFAGNDALYDVAAPAADDAWAVGSFETSTGLSSTLVEHWDGAAWTAVASPNPNPAGTNSLAGVAAVPGVRGAAWAVGSYSDPRSSIDRRSLVLRRSGGPWQVSPAPAVASSDFLEAVDATGPADAWAVGWGSNGPYSAPGLGIALHWDGAAWRSVPIPVSTPAILSGVDAVAPNDVWAVGQAYPGGPFWTPLILHFNGTAWTRVAVPSLPQGGQLDEVVALSRTDAYAVGSAGDGTGVPTLILHWDGRAWTREPAPSPPTSPQLHGVTAVGPSTVWAVGNSVSQAAAGGYQTLTLRTQNG
jgi:hypothetical protein